MKKIKLFDPEIGISEEREMIKILRSGFWASGSGRGKVQEFEKKFSKYLNSDQCVAVNSGTAALNLALSLLDIKNNVKLYVSDSSFDLQFLLPKNIKMYEIFR